MIKHSRSSQNSKFAMSLQYLKKEVKPEIDFLHAYKHQSFSKFPKFPKVDIIINEHYQSFSNT